MNKGSKGITLIALVITIIVMLILVAVTINIAINGGIFSYARKATRDTEHAKQDELKIAEGSLTIDGKKYDSPEDYIAGVELGFEKFSAIYTETKEYKETIDGVEKTTAWIPKGFSVGTSEGINKVEDGLVIQDEKGNQFVWIPVSVSTTAEFDALRNGASINNEPCTEGYTNEQTEYETMRTKVMEKGGFYIGRYEAGSTTPRAGNTPGTTTPVVVKRDAYPYNNVCWGIAMDNYETPRTYTYNDEFYDFGYGAVYLSKNMYTDNTKYGVVSTLCYGVQWDAMLNFIGKANETDSTSWGNYKNNIGETWEITRQTARYSEDYGKTWKLISNEPTKKKEKTSNASILLTTGANDKFQQKNIFDVAGNCMEKTMEASFNTNRVGRGGTYFVSGEQDPASLRSGGSPTSAGTNNSFRLTLYVI